MTEDSAICPDDANRDEFYAHWRLAQGAAGKLSALQLIEMAEAYAAHRLQVRRSPPAPGSRAP
jgi:hypothetical protein